MHVNCIANTDENNKFLIIVGHSIFKTGLLTIPLEIYRNDILAQGWEASIVTISQTDINADYVCKNGTALKSIIKSYYQSGYKGFVLIGSKDIPLVWWRCRYSDPDGCDATDLYYADMDEWTSKKDSMYVTYDSNEAFIGSTFGPELFCGRICAGGITTTVNEETIKVASYLDKIHQYRVNNGNLTDEQKNRALIFLQSDSYNHKNIDSWPENAVCINLRTLCNNNVTNSLNFITEMEKGYRFVHIRAHSGHDYNGFITTELLREIKPKFNFLNLFGCGACTYTTKNFGAVYLFDNDYSLNITGSTGGWGVSPDEQFYKDLNYGVPVGIAFQAFINRDMINVEIHPPDGEVGWPKGVLLGDPLLTYASGIKLYKTPRIQNDLIDLQANVGSQYTLILSVHNPDMRSFQYKMNNPPLNATLEGNTIKWTPPDGSEGIHFIEIKAVDDTNGEYSEIFSITVNGHSDKLLNGGFEEGYANQMNAWFPEDLFICRWDSTGIAHTGAKCLYFNVPIQHESVTGQYLQLKPLTDYTLTGWIKGKNIVSSADTPEDCKLKGASLIVENSLNSAYFNSDLTGTFDWIIDSCMFRTPENGVVLIACTLGYCTDETTGEAWFDDISVSLQNVYSGIENEEIVPGSIQIFPNPSAGDFYIEYVNKVVRDTYIVLTNYIGQTIYSEKYLSTGGLNRKMISLDGLKPGIYILKMVTGNDYSVCKLLIAH